MKIVQLIAALLVGMSTSVLAASIDTTQLTPEQRAELEVQAAKMKQASVAGSGNLSSDVRGEVSAWGEMGKNMGVAMVAAAKEVGVAASEFAQTPLGKITTAIVVWKLVGHDLARAALHVVGAFTILIAGIAFALWFFRKFPVEVLEWETQPRMFGWGTKRVPQRTRIDDEFKLGGSIIGVITLVLTTIIFITLLSSAL